MIDGARLSRLLDKQEICETLYRFARGIDRLDADLVAAAFHEDAVDDHGPFKGCRDDFVNWSMGILAGYGMTHHRLGNVLIDFIEPDVAHCETLLLAMHTHPADGYDDLVFARYIDRFDRRDGAWKIGKRQVLIDYSTRIVVTAPYEDVGQYLTGRRDRADACYWPEHQTNATRSPLNTSPSKKAGD